MFLATALSLLTAGSMRAGDPDQAPELTCLDSRISAQQGELFVEVVDVDGAPLADATVKVESYHPPVEARTDAEGRVCFELATSPGYYYVTASAEGYGREERPNVEIVNSERAALKMEMSPPEPGIATVSSIHCPALALLSSREEDP